ncbi:MAG: hypothetical protein D6693_06535 [Planctomycetota bacterium]|nr:MAG: hypothetical protein D6693_06535 [Planctomycetota bacterium]
MPAWAVSAPAAFALLAAATAVMRLAPTRWKDRALVGFGVDAAIGAFTLGPFAVALAIPAARAGGPVAWGVAPLVSSLVYLALWCVADERIRGERGGFRIRRYWIRRDGWLRYALGWSILLAVPVFWMVRLAQVVVYPMLNVAWGLPRLRTRDYIALSRHKTEGLVGADYLFCLYCEWMTGLWSLGTEMLRHLESMWCPLRFGRADQCERCAATFPDIREWAPAEGGMAGVERFYELHYEGAPLGDRAHLGARGATPRSTADRG